jgi:glutamate-1-semialdehyde aminotransferase
MVFGRFFKRDDDDAGDADGVEGPPDPDDGADESEVDHDDTVPPEGHRDVDVDLEWRDRAADVIPGGASTGSKQPGALYGADTRFGPTHYVRAAGCRVVTPGQRSLIDCSMALGAVTLGYADEAVTQAVVQASTSGNIAGLSSYLEIEIAERLCDAIPCAEQVRMMKSGAEAVAAAVRIARTCTGRSQVVGSGYFGWSDWCSSAAGVPAAVSALYSSVPFDDIAALTAACDRAGSDLAAIIIEPVVERLPSTEWIAAARELCTRFGAVLIFDEIKTGFRLRLGGYQEYAGVEPDLCTLGKAMSNGMPISAVAGRADVMQAATRTWISSTLSADTVGLAAVGAVLDWFERADVSEFLWKSGDDTQRAIARAIDAASVTGVQVAGIPPMWFLRFDRAERESRFLELALDEGVLFKRGPYNFPSLAHDEETIAEIESAASRAFVTMVEEADA